MDDSEIEERLEAIGRVTIRRMFGGKGIYSEGCIVALVVRGELLLKADAETAPLFEEAGSRRWTYERAGKSPVAMPYFTLPDEALDDPDVMAEWARRARAAGHRTGRRRRNRTGVRQSPTKTVWSMSALKARRALEIGLSAFRNPCRSA